MKRAAPCAPAELTHLVRAILADGSTGGVRDTATLAVLYMGGLRRAELAGLDLANVRIDTSGARLRVIGKGNRERRVFIEPGAQAALEAWLRRRGDRPGALFCRVSKAGRVVVPAVRAAAHDVHFPYAVNADPSPSEKVSASSREANPGRN